MIMRWSNSSVWNRQRTTASSRDNLIDESLGKNDGLRIPVSIAQGKTAVSPLLMQWRYCSLALSHQYSDCLNKSILQGPVLNISRHHADYIAKNIHSHSPLDRIGSPRIQMPRFLRSLVSVVEEPLAEPAPDSFRLSRRELGGAMATEAGPEGWWSREALLLQGHTGNERF